MEAEWDGILRPTATIPFETNSRRRNERTTERDSLQRVQPQATGSRPALLHSLRQETAVHHGPTVRPDAEDSRRRMMVKTAAVLAVFLVVVWLCVRPSPPDPPDDDDPMFI